MSEQFGHYVLETMIGRGGMGEVYRAYDTDKDRVVALKRLPKDLVADEVFEARFRRECRLAARLNEPHVIPIHDFGEIEGHLYLDMRLVEGVDLSTVIHDGGPMRPKVAVDIVGQIGSALQAAHNAGLVHRDIKPSNVLVTGMEDDAANVFAYLVDFGIARSEAGGGATALTSTTGTVGTLGYMAPERISGKEGDSRSDIYSLACVLFECLTGHSPYKGETFQVMFAHVNAPAPMPSAEVPGLPRRLDDVIRKGLAKDPEQRYQTANQFSAAARAALSDAGVTPPLPGNAPRMPPPPPQGGPRRPSAPPFAGAPGRPAARLPAGPRPPGRSARPGWTAGERSLRPTAGTAAGSPAGAAAGARTRRARARRPPVSRRAGGRPRRRRSRRRPGRRRARPIARRRARSRPAPRRGRCPARVPARRPDRSPRRTGRRRARSRPVRARDRCPLFRRAGRRPARSPTRRLRRHAGRCPARPRRPPRSRVRTARARDRSARRCRHPRPPAPSAAPVAVASSPTAATSSRSPPPWWPSSSR